MIRPLPPAPSRDNPGPFAAQSDALLAALAGFVDDCNALEQSLIFVGTTGQSSTSLSVGSGAKTLTASTGKAWVIGAWVHLVSAGGIGNVMVGQVLAYDVDTGALQVNVGAFAGSGTYSDWLIGLSSPQAPITSALIANGALAAKVGAEGGLLLPGDADAALKAVPRQQAETIAGGAAADALSAARASTANVTAEQNADTFISPDRLKFAKAAVKAWVNFDGTGATGAVTPRSSYNVASVTKNGSGDFTVAPSTQSDALGAFLVSVGSGGTGAFYTINAAAAAPTTTTRRFQIGDVSGFASNPGYIFCALVGA